jgi:hypothetical protein
VVAVARNGELLASLRDELGGTLTTVVADAADPVVAGSPIEHYRPDTRILNAGSPPSMRPIQHHTWPKWPVRSVLWSHSVASFSAPPPRRFGPFMSVNGRSPADDAVDPPRPRFCHDTAWLGLVALRELRRDIQWW